MCRPGRSDTIQELLTEEDLQPKSDLPRPPERCHFDSGLQPFSDQNDLRTHSAPVEGMCKFNSMKQDAITYCWIVRVIHDRSGRAIRLLEVLHRCRLVGPRLEHNDVSVVALGSIGGEDFLDCWGAQHRRDDK